MRFTYGGKTEQEWFEAFTESLYHATFKYRGSILDKPISITLWFDKDGNLLWDDVVSMLNDIPLPLSKDLKEELNIDDNWADNCIEIEAEYICQLLLHLNRDDLLRVSRDLLNCCV